MAPDKPDTTPLPAGAAPTRAARSEGAREAIMDGARDLFYVQGVASTSVRDIAARAEVSLSTIYLHFGTKEEIIRAVMERSHRIARTPVEEVLLAPDQPSLRKLLLGFRVHVMQQMVVTKEATISSYGMVELSGEAREELRTLGKTYEAMFQRLAEQLADSGEIATANLAVKVRMLLTAGIHVGRWFKAQGLLPPEAIADIYVDLCRNSLRP